MASALQIIDALRRSSDVRRPCSQSLSFSVAEGVLEFSFSRATASLVKPLTQAFAHLAGPPGALPAAFYFRIEIASVAECPALPAGPGDGIYLLKSEASAIHSIAVQWSEKVKVLFNFDEQRALVLWDKPVDNHESAAPLRFVLAWALRYYRRFLVHAAAVRSPKGDLLLLIGPGGTGKSTLSLAGLLGVGWAFLGDDYVVVSQEGDSFFAHSLYSTGKLSDDALRREPLWDSFRLAPSLRYHEKNKTIYFLGDLFRDRFLGSARINFLVSPLIAAQRPPHELRPITAGASLRQLAPSTLFQTLMPQPEDFRVLSRLAKSARGFEFTLGQDSLRNLRELENRMAAL